MVFAPLDFFKCLESSLEPVFNYQTYPRLDPALCQTLHNLKLLKEIKIDTVSCDKCADDGECSALEIKYDEREKKYYHICRSGWLKNPVWLPAEVVKGWQFDFDKIANLICEKASLQTIDWSRQPASYMEHSCRLFGKGQINQQTVKAFWALNLNQNNFRNRLLGLSNTYPGDNLIVFSPYFEPLTGDDKNMLTDNRIHLFALKTVFENDFNITELIMRRIAQPESTVKAIATFPLPQGMALTGVSIMFDPPNMNTGTITEWVKISYQGRSQRFHYAELGCKDKKSGRYDKQWITLHAFAKNQGRISWDMFNKRRGKTELISEDDGENNDDTSSSAPQLRKRPTGGIPALEKRIQALRQILKSFFNTQEDPFYPYSTKDGYRTKFKIEIAEDESSPDDTI